MTSPGKCNVCGGVFEKPKMMRHLKKCLAASEPTGPPRAGSGQNEKVSLIFVEATHLPDYWLYVEVPASAPLWRLDAFLRRIWLECCEHMSAFNFADGIVRFCPTYEEDFDGRQDDPLGRVAPAGTKFSHEYDFGTPTYLSLRVVAEREAPREKATKTQESVVRLLARNEQPPVKCRCGGKATSACRTCDEWICDECSKGHPCGVDPLLPVVNSPRTGVCGYTGR